MEFLIITLALSVVAVVGQLGDAFGQQNTATR
jgi:hypothetical protein